VAGIAAFLYNNFDQLTLIPLVPLAVLGVYGAVASAYYAYYELITVLGSVLLAIFSGVYGAKGSEGLRHSVRNSSRYVSIVAMPLAFALVAVSRPALTLLVGNGYEAGTIPLVILAVASTTTIISMSLFPILIVMNETLLAALTSIIPLSLGFGIALVLIPVSRYYWRFHCSRLVDGLQPNTNVVFR